MDTHSTDAFRYSDPNYTSTREHHIQRILNDIVARLNQTIMELNNKDAKIVDVTNELKAIQKLSGVEDFTSTIREQNKMIDEQNKLLTEHTQTVIRIKEELPTLIAEAVKDADVSAIQSWLESI